MSDDKVVPIKSRFKNKEGKVQKHVTVDDLIANATTEDGAIDLAAIDNAPAVGYNGGVKCDVTKGPCSCGAWH